MADNETTEDIIAWLRRPREGENAYLTLWRDEIADRLEAAQKRERGNCAKLREALEKVAASAKYAIEQDDLDRGDLLGFVEEMGQDAHFALSAPPRNCDVGTAEEQNVRYNQFCYAQMKRNNHCCGPCPCYKFINGEAQACTLIWAQMPYEEGGAK